MIGSSVKKVVLGALLCFCATIGSVLGLTQNEPWSVYSATQQSSPQIVAITATPGALLSSTGNVDAQLSTTCLGPCPNTPSYTLNTPTSGSCSSNNNNLFSLTGAGHLTASNLPSYGYVCVATTIAGATNSGITLPVYIPNVSPPTITYVTVTPAYFASGSAFSGKIDLSCSSNATIGGAGCTGVPSYTLDNTAGHCTHPNDPLFSVSGSTLSINTPQSTAKTYYACVDATVPGAANSGAPFQLAATISNGYSGATYINSVYFNPPYHAPNSAYSGTLVAYCAGSVASPSAPVPVPCGGTPSFSFQTSCGGNNNSNFTLSGPGNSIVTSNGSLSSGTLFPCISATAPGTTAFPATYVGLYENGAATLKGISVLPWYFTAATGSMSGKLKPVCANALCTGTPGYTLDSNAAAHCTNGNNTPFTLSGSTLTVTTSTPGTYVACLDLAMAGASNSGAAFPVTVTASASASNCPATPPPQAVAAGFTQLVYCLDPPQPLYANIFNWINCAPTVLTSTGNQYWQASNVGVDCGASETHLIASRITDPITLKQVIDFHWDGLADTNAWFANFFTLSSPTDYPTAMYAEYRMRLAPTTVPSYTSQCCAPDFWTFVTNQGDQGQANAYPPGCIKYDPVNYCYTGGGELDILESGNGQGWLDAIHETAVPNDAAGHPQCCLSGQSFFDGIELYNANNMPDPVGFEAYTTYGARFATDGVGVVQYCYYWDDVLVQAHTSSGTPRFGPGCQYVDFTGKPALQYGALRQRHQFDLWFSGGWAFNSPICTNFSSSCNSNGDQGQQNQDTYVEYIAIWTCPNYNQYNLGNGLDSQPVCPVSNPFPTP